MRVAKVSRPRYYVELTGADLRTMVFDVIAESAKSEVDRTAPVYVQIAEGNGIDDEIDELEDHCDYTVTQNCTGTQVRFIVETDAAEELQSRDGLAPPQMAAQTPRGGRRRGD